MIQDPILIVDDESELRLPLRDALIAGGYTVEDAPDAESALALLEQKHFPVILTDLHMPGGPSGLDLIAAVRGRDPRTLCIVITGYASLDVAVEAIKRGAYDFVQKPFKLVEIEAVLDRALEHARLLAQLEAYRRDLEDRVVSRARTLRAFHEEVLHMNSLLMDAQIETDAARLVTPFVAHVERQFAPDGIAVLQAEASRWEVLVQKGERPWAPKELPEPSDLKETLELSWDGGYPDGRLIPLRAPGLCLGALFLGFERRSAFDPEESSFVLLKVHMQAALHGFFRARLLAASEARKALGQD